MPDEPESSAPIPGAEDFERRKRTIGLIVGPALFLGILAWPTGSLTPEGHRLLAVFVWTVVYWVTEALPVAITALLSSVLAIVLGIAPAATVFAAYADPVVFLFVGTFMIAEAMKTSRLDRRLALALLRSKWATQSTSRLMLAAGAVTCALSLWMSNTATTAIMLPVGVGILRALGEANRASPVAVALLLMLTWSSSVAVGLPIASPPNLIAIGMIRDLAGRRLTFFDWAAVTMPLTVAMLLLAWVTLRCLYGNSARRPAEARVYVSQETAQLGPWTRPQINVLVVFIVAAVLWMLPGTIAMIHSPEAPIARWLETRLPESAVAVGAAVLLFLLPTDYKRGLFTISWRDATRIDWATIFLFGGGLVMGTLMFDTGLARTIGDAVMGVSGLQSVWGLTALAIVFGVLLSELSSNTASASVVIPIVIAVAQAAGVSAIAPALGAALGASFGFMLPISTPPNAIVYGSGLVPLREMIRSGIYADIAGAILIWIGLRLLCPLFGVM